MADCSGGALVYDMPECKLNFGTEHDFFHDPTVLVDKNYWTKVFASQKGMSMSSIRDCKEGQSPYRNMFGLKRNDGSTYDGACRYDGSNYDGACSGCVCE
jgi:hypothetical protein